MQRLVNRAGLPALLLCLVSLASTPAAADEAEDQYRVAAGHYARRQWELAAEEFRAFVRQYPGHENAAAASFYLGESLVQLRRFDDAREHFRDYLFRAPDGEHAARARFRVGETGYLGGDAEQAGADLRAFHERHPRHAANAYALTYLAEIALAGGRVAEAEAGFRRALDEYPQGALQDDCRFGRARALEKLDRGEEAEWILEALAAKRASPVADKAQFHLAARHYAQRRYEAARAALADFETRFPGSPLRARAGVALGRALFQLGRYAEARRVLKPLRAHGRAAAEAGYWRGLAHKAEHDWQAAATELRAAARAHPGHPLAAAMLLHAGDALRLAGKPGEAADCLSRALACGGDGPWRDDILLCQARVALARGQHDEVDRLAEEIAERFPEGVVGRLARRAQVQSLLQRKQHARVETILQPLLEDASSPLPLVDRYYLAAAYAGGGKYDQALAVLEEVLLGADGELLDNAHVVRATALIALGRHGDAVPDLEHYLDARPDGPWAATCQAELACCQLRPGNLEASRRALASLQALYGEQGELIAQTRLRLADEAYAQQEFAWSAELYGALAGDAATPKELVPRGLSGLAWSQLKLRELDASADAFLRLLDGFPDHELAAEAALLRGQILHSLGRDEPALATLLSLVERYPESEGVPSALRAAAQICDRRGRDAEADALYRRLVEEHADAQPLDAVLYEWAWVLRDMKQRDEAGERFERLHREFPDSEFWHDATYRLAQDAYQAADYPRAEQLLSALCEKDPPRQLLAHAWFLRGSVAVAAQQWERAEQAMARVHEQHGDTAWGLTAAYWRAEAQYQQGRYTAAAASFAELSPRLAACRDDWRPMVPLRHAQALVHLKQWQQAQQIAEGIARDYPRFALQYEADYVLGRCLAARAKFREAREAYMRVVQSPTGGKSETAAMAQWMIGEAYFHQQKFGEALRAYLRVEILYAYPQWQAAALLQAGKCYEHQGQWAQAAEVYLRIVNEYADTDFKRDAMLRLETARRRSPRKG